MAQEVSGQSDGRIDQQDGGQGLSYRGFVEQDHFRHCIALS